MTDQKRRTIGIVLAIFLTLSFALPVAADQPPRLPSAFYGTVTQNGQNVPNGTLVSAWINGVQYAETTTFLTTIGSQQVSVYTITVPGDDPSTPGVVEGGNEGDTVYFQVNGHLTDQTGTWHEGTDVELNLTLTINYPPSVVSVSPNQSNTMPLFFNPFVAIYEDPNGWNDLRDVYLMWNTTPSDNIQRFRYDVLANKLYIPNDANDDWIGGFAPGTDVQLTNTNVTLDVSRTQVVTTTTQVQVTWYISEKQPMTSVNWNLYLKAVDSASQSTGWVSRGTRRVNMFPNVGGLTPASGTVAVGTPQTFTVTYSDEDGTGTLTMAFIRVTMQTPPYTEQFRACYKTKTNEVLVYTGSQWLGPLPMGQPGTLETASVRIDLAASSVSIDATSKVLTVNWNLIFKPGSEGAKDIWGYIYDDQNWQDGFVLVGHWMVGGGSAVAAQRDGVAPEPDAPIPPDAGPDFAPVLYSTDIYAGAAADESSDAFKNRISASKAMLPYSEARMSKAEPYLRLYPMQPPLPNAMPTIGIVSPAESFRQPGWGRNFRFQIIDNSGYAHVSQVHVLFTLDGSTQNAIYIRYDQDTNRVYLRDPSDDTIWLGGYTLGTSVKISNRHGTVDLAKSRIAAYSNYLNLYLEIINKEIGAPQRYRILVRATDDDGNDTGWVEKGWRMVDHWPGVGGVTPAANAQRVGTTYSYTTTFTEPQSWQGLKYVFLNIASAPGSASQSLYACYIIATNQIKIRNDSGAWIGPITPGSAQDLQNSWVILHGAGTSVTKTGDMLTITWSLEFKSTLTGTTKNIYLYAQDALDWVDPWRYAGFIQITP